MTNAAPAIKLSTLRQIAPYLSMRSVLPLEFFRRFGISPHVFQNPDAWVPRAACFHIANEMAAIAQDPFAGASVGHLTDVRSLGAWGELILGSTSLAQACAMAAVHTQLLHQGGEVNIVTEGRTTKLIHHFNGQHGADPKQVITASLVVLRKVPLMSGEPGAIRVHLKNPRERGDEALEEYLGPNLHMNAEYNMIEFDRELLEIPLHYTRDIAWKTTQALKSTTETADVLAKQIADQELSKLATISRTIGLSPRTLQRRLEHCGIDFDALRDETRRSEAFQLLASGKYSATEIAYMVGYSDPAHFTRAFKRWTGSPPSRYRSILLKQDR
ncbi:AraC family transcriptional regulator [Pseudomonas veronii]|uniref:AraC family transcriptional regulator n=1 Tax=Pseudomonas veronii TaxID=76761 RepID=A0A7Y1F5Z2_PSEVE|nr:MULTISPECIES: AraC family transcriptional regulator [Pseudomonas]SEB71828.1 Helix-turn-helix domain-containing protein [Pseudomonas marginalis]KRP68469.1 AraC family transcriptional regulator [Pseudomonas veronii]NMY00836.1 AraC family transcriptional regulator [Pseudomonas veronii]OPK00652.1 AraC family transcriptional regulator [Pseudomonas veronii]RWA26178.1 AraC family transcriptional regulator [Pseudomonas veronii]